MTVTIGILGPVELHVAGEPAPIGSPKQRALLSMLAVEPGRIVSAERLIDALWEDTPPATGANSLQVAVSQLRRRFGSARDRVATRAPGYALELREDDQLDATHFATLVASARNSLDAGEPLAAHELLGEALALWKGDALADCVYESWAQDYVSRLSDARDVAIELRFDAALAAGWHDRIVGDLESHVRREPLRERPREQLMLALFRSGRQAEALAAYQDARRVLVDELGIDPSPALQQLERQILQHDPALAAPPSVLNQHAASAHAVSTSKAPTAVSATTQAFESDVASELVGPLLRRIPVGATLVGRNDELSKVLAALAQGERCVTLTGPGGIGKSSLALAVARAQADGADDGGDGAGAGDHDIVFVELTDARSGEAICAAIAQALELPTEGSEPDEAMLLQRLNVRPALLVLDNLEQVIEAAARVTATLLDGCASLTLVATSREALRIAGEQVVVLDPLGLPPEPAADETLVQYAQRVAQSDSVTLLLARARAHDSAFAPDAEAMSDLAAICRRLDGLPLGIELAASQLRIMGTAALRERLAERLDSMSSRARGIPERQRSLRAAIEWSVETMPLSIMRAHSIAGAFAGSFDSEAFAASWNAANSIDSSLVGNAEDMLSELVERSLLVPRGVRSPRFGMLQAVREHARGLLAGDERLEQAVLDAHAGHYVALATGVYAAGADGQPQVSVREDDRLDRLRGEFDNFAVALDHLHVTEQHDELAELVWQLSSAWFAEGRLHEAASWARRTLELEGTSGIWRARMLDVRGRMERALGQWDLAAAAHSESLTLFQGARDDQGIAAASLGVGDCASWQGDYDAARDALADALKHAELASDGMRIALIQNQLGLVHSWRGEPAEAARCFELGHARFEELGSTHGRDLARNNLAIELHALGDRDRAGELVLAALESARMRHDVHGVVIGHINLADFALEAHDAETAVEHSRRAAAGAVRLGDAQLQVVAACNEAWAQTMLGAANQAVALLEQALAVVEQCGDGRLAGLVAYGLARAAAEAGDLTTSSTTYGLAAVLLPEQPPQHVCDARDADLAAATGATTASAATKTARPPATSADNLADSIESLRDAVRAIRLASGAHAH